MAQPWPPGSEPDLPGADTGTVKPPGGELARVWNDQYPGSPAPAEAPPARTRRLSSEEDPHV